MANLSIREAVKYFDVSRPTLTKSLKNGKLSGIQDGQGQWQIDPAELARVYRPRTEKAGKSANYEQANLSIVNTPLVTEVEALKERLAQAEQRAVVAEALAEERKRILSEALKLIPPPASVPPADPEPAPANAPEFQPIPPRPWIWRILKGNK